MAGLGGSLGYVMGALDWGSLGFTIGAFRQVSVRAAALTESKKR